MTGEAGNLPGSEIRKGLSGHLHGLFLKRGYFIREINAFAYVVANMFQLIDVSKKLSNRLLEIQIIYIHA